MKKNILFIAPVQYGYNTDFYNYCELLSAIYNVSYLGFDMGKPIRESQSVNVKLLNLSPFRFWRFTMLKEVWHLKKKQNYDRVILYYFPLCSLFLLLFSKKIVVMDVRTSFIEGKVKSKLLNRLLSIESRLFCKISVISWGVADFLRLDKTKCKLLPLGGDDVSYSPKRNDSVDLLYVGTFYDRYIEKTIEGLSLYLKNHPSHKVHYTIVGFGTKEDIEKIMKAIHSNHLENFVSFVGERRHKELVPFFTTHNVGVSYIPLTDYYDCQPPTKTYEYLLNSMIVLATPTTENIKVINKSNGVLMNGDSPEDFALGIEQTRDCLRTVDFKLIYNESQQYTWNNIVKKYLLPIIDD